MDAGSPPERLQYFRANHGRFLQDFVIAGTPVLTMKTGVDELVTLTFEPAREGVLSWNSFTESGTISFRLLRAQSAATPWLDYAQWSAEGRQSFSPAHDDVNVQVDVIRAAQPFDGIEVRARGVEFKAVAFASPVRTAPSLPYLGDARILDVPARSQYVQQEQRGWCSAASLSMLNAYHGLDYDVEATAAAVFDRAYQGTGNWTFNVAFSGSLGLRAAVVYLRNLDHAARLTGIGMPLAISYSWKQGELPGAPLEHSDGHLAVLCGFTANGDCAMNDPAAPHVRVVYPRAALERIWQRNAGVAYAVAPVGIDYLPIVNS
ncbi:MAG TPA: C39 family peptidase [Candidatus Baltobacteraceae bacterium]|nr:C39 family peptidase [Candidatus Baltobacteraceae bacterium]